VSFDRKIDQTCDHGVSEEALFVAADRRTVRPLRPISASNSVRVLLNNAIQVPSEGVYLPAKSSGTRRGPFSISPTTNTLELVVNQGATQTVVLPNVSQMEARRMAALLNQNVTGVTFAVKNQRLTFESRDKGAGASIFLKDSSTAASVFGFYSNREFRGRTSVPGWTLVSDPTTLADRPTRLIVFDQPLRSGSDFVEISYVTIREECRRCGGLGVENDWRYDANGKVVEVRDEDLLVQELLKDFYTIGGSNPFHTWYGTQLIEGIGKKLSSQGFAQNLVVSDLYQAFGRWQSIKRQQEEKVGQFVSDREFPFRLLGVNLEESSQDPTVIFITVTVQNRSNEPIQLTRGLKLPAALALTA
jgi:hypothetical protein